MCRASTKKLDILKLTTMIQARAVFYTVMGSEVHFNQPNFAVLPLPAVHEQLACQPGSDLARVVAAAHQALLEEDSLLPSGLAVMWILRQLGLGDELCLAAVLSDPRLAGRGLEADCGESVAALVASVRWLQSLTATDKLQSTVPEQAEYIRRLLVQAVDDVRAILIQLAYRVERMRHLSQEPVAKQRHIARMTLDIYAPLANRLGIGQLKWELEDFSFRYLEPEAYQNIARNLEERRSERERYVEDFVARLQALLQAEGITASVSGRAKHIYSIAKKMRQKSLRFDELFDVRAVRIIASSLADCYAVLGLVHNRWPHIAAEFDDYIARPKANGYQSLHTVVVAEQNKTVEVQIRTQAMHEQAESGVAAHWRYKEQGGGDQLLARNINALRQLLDADELDEELLAQFKTNARSHRVFVFTPTGEIIGLPEGATPVDFAYAIHTEVGHRCRGAKVNGSIVPLNYTLQDADSVEVITAREGGPTREWLNPQLGYIHNRATRAKVRNWFNKRDYAQHVEDGGYIYERELSRHRGRDVSDEAYRAYFGKASVDDMLADIGRGAITGKQLLGAIQALKHPLDAAAEPERRRQPPQDSEVSVQGVGNVMTHRASCCQPIPGDAIIGFITRGRGVSVHRQDCANIQALAARDMQRLVPVNWSGGEQDRAEVELLLQAYDREGLLRDVTAVLSREHVYLNAVSTQSDQKQQTAKMRLTVALQNTAQLSLLMDQLLQIPNVYEVLRGRQ